MARRRALNGSGTRNKAFTIDFGFTSLKRREKSELKQRLMVKEDEGG
jgi:hypothetical protein